MEALDEALSHLPFELLDLVGSDPIHVIPEALGGKPCRIGREQTGEGGLTIPIGKLEFAGRTDGAIDGGKQKVLAGGQPWWRLGRRIESRSGTRSSF